MVVNMKCVPDIKKRRIEKNKRVLADLIQRPIADCFEGKPRKIIRGEDIGVKFNYVCMYLYKETDLDDLDCWKHELVEHAVSKVLLKMLIEEGLTLYRIADIICDGVILTGLDGGLYGSKVKHIIASLCTNSTLGEKEKVTPEEFAEFFGF